MFDDERKHLHILRFRHVTRQIRLCSLSHPTMHAFWCLETGNFYIGIEPMDPVVRSMERKAVRDVRELAFNGRRCSVSQSANSQSCKVRVEYYINGIREMCCRCLKSGIGPISQIFSKFKAYMNMWWWLCEKFCELSRSSESSFVRKISRY